MLRLSQRITAAMEPTPESLVSRAKACFTIVKPSRPDRLEALALATAIFEACTHKDGALQLACTVNLAHCMIASGNFDDAIDLLERLLVLPLAEKGSILPARESADEIMRQNPGPWGEAWAALGNALASAHRHDDAVICYFRALDVFGSPSTMKMRQHVASVLLSLGHSLHQCGRWLEGQAAFQRAAQLQPQWPHPHLHLAIHCRDEQACAQHQRDLADKSEVAETQFGDAFGTQFPQHIDPAMSGSQVVGWFARVGDVRTIVHFEDVSVGAVKVKKVT
eukprot:c19789_g1_i3.p2 GENE.c19789_g1_i3~~c19789_g1_i3.p2  ORF type:complete len:279 (+),score=38.91 c19789_g1_i3:1050-1886(+)